MVHSSGGAFVRDAVVATVAVVGLYGLAQGVQFPPTQIPGYLLVVGFDLLEMAFGSVGAYYDVLFAAYLLGLGLVGAAVAHVFQGWTRETERPGWRFGVAGALAVVGALSLLFGLAVSLGTDQWAPTLITGAAGLVMLALASWLGGLIEFESDRPRTGER